MYKCSICSLSYVRVNIPKLMVPPCGSDRKLDLLRRFPIVSTEDYNGTGRKNTRKMEAAFLPEFTRTVTVDLPELPGAEKKTEQSNILQDDHGNNIGSRWKR